MDDQLVVIKQQVQLRESSTSLWNVEMVGIYYLRDFSQMQTVSFDISLHMSGTHWNITCFVHGTLT